MSLNRSAVLAVLTCLSLAVVPAPASAVTTIDTGVDTAAGSYCMWGFPDTATYGQTFVAPAGDTVLDRFSFRMIRGGVDTATIAYRAFVYEWDVDRAVGSSVWQSPAQQQVTLASDDYMNPDEVEAHTGGVALEAGQTYVAFLSTSLDYEANDEADVACVSPGLHAYSGGRFVFNGDLGDEWWWTEVNWPDFGDADLAFEADFRAP